MATEDNKQTPEKQATEKTREDEIREWNESQSNSMLKAKGGSNKATGIALIVATVAGLGFVYWLNNSGDSKATGGLKKKKWSQHRPSVCWILRRNVRRQR